MINWLIFGGVCAKQTFFGLVPWYQYLNYGPQTSADGSTYCGIISFNVLPTNGKSDFGLVLLAVVDDLLRIAGLVAVGFVIYGAVKYTTSQGVPDETSKAQSTVVNALIGLVVAMIGVGLVSFIGKSFN